MFKRSLLLLLLISQSAFGQSAQPIFDRLSKLRDVLLSSPQNTQVLTYDSASGKWKNANSAGGGGGTVTTFSAGNLSPLFTTSVLNASTTPALSFSLSTAAAHAFLGNNTGSVAAPAYVQPAFSDISGTLDLGGAQASGTLAAAREPAHTGDVTNSAGSLILTLVNIPDLTTQAASILATNIAAPANPAANKTKVYVDSTSKNISAKNDAGTVNHGIQTRTATASNWVRSIADDGTTGISQPAFTDVSGTATSGQIPALGGNPSVNVTLSAQNGTATTYLRSDGAPALSQAIAPVWTAAHTWTISDGAAGATTILTVNHDTSLTPAIGDGSAIIFGAKSSTTNDRAQTKLSSHWSDVTDATRTSYFAVSNVLSGTGPTTDRFFVFGSGGASLYTKQDSGAGIFYTEFGLQIGNVTPAAGRLPLSDGTKYVESGYALPTAVGAAGNRFVSNGTNVTSTAPASFQGTSASPAGTTSTIGVMMGVSGTITPTFSGRIIVSVTGNIKNGTIADGASMHLRTGTGTKPVNAAALTGTAVGGAPQLQNTPSATFICPISDTAIVTGLAVGTAVWLDVDLAAITGGTATLQSVAISAFEF